jgi:hypothetical protein
MGGDGFTIREVSHNFTTTPTVNDDDTKGFVVDSRWILDDGDVYVCTDDTTGAAVWVLQSSGIPTLQEVLDNNHDLVDGNFFAGTEAGDLNTGINVNALGGNAANNNTGENVNAFGNSAGLVNSFNNVNLFGNSASADEDGQTVLSKDGAIMARISTTDLTDTRKYNLPDASGTLALITDIPTLQQVTDEGNETSNSISVTDNSENKTTLQQNGINFSDLDDGGNTILRFENTSTVDQEVLVRGLSGTMALISDITIPTLQEVTTEGNETTNPIKVIDTGNTSTQLQATGIVFDDLDDLGSTFLSFQQNSEPIQQVVEIRPLGGTIALTSDIPDTSTLVPYTGATANVDLGTHKLLAEDLDINHTSGSGVAASITKGGSGEALTVVKTSGSGNAASITGGVTLLDELHLTTDLADTYIASAATWNAKFTLPALTSGSVLFSNGSTIAQDNAQLFWDDTNNRLGIGTNAPTQSLDVRGVVTSTTSLVGNMIVLNGANNTNLTLFNDSDGRSFLTVKGNTSAASAAGAYFTADGFQESWFNVIARGASSGNKHWRFGNIGSGAINNLFAIQKLNDAGNAITSTALAVFSSTSNVGINTTTDAGFRLDVNGITRLNGNTSIGGGTAGARLDVRAQGALSTDIAFRVRNSADSANLVTVAGNGNVGIGTNTPLFNLDLLFNNSSTTPTGLNIKNTNTLGRTSAIFVNNNNEGGSFSTYGSSFSATPFRNNFAVTATKSLIFLSDSEIGSGGSSTISFITGGYNQSNALMILSNKNILINTTTDDGFRLDVNGTQRVQGKLSINTPTEASSVMEVTSTTQGFLPPRMTTTQKNAIASPAAGLVVYDSTLGKLCVRTASAWETITSI